MAIIADIENRIRLQKRYRFHLYIVVVCLLRKCTLNLQETISQTGQRLRKKCNRGET
jgi:hypothetical protein